MSFARLLIPSTLATSGLFYVSHRHPRTLHCDAAPLPTKSHAQTTLPLLDPHQFATGSVLGIASGLIFKRLGKLFFLIVGGTYLVLRALGTGTGATVPGLSQIRVPLNQLKRFILNRSGFGDGVNRVSEVGESPIVTLLTKDLTFKLSFLATFMIGLVNT